MDFNIKFNLDIKKVKNSEGVQDDAYEITEIYELIESGHVSIRKYGDDMMLIDNTRGDISIGKISKLQISGWERFGKYSGVVL